MLTNINTHIICNNTINTTNLIQVVMLENLITRFDYICINITFWLSIQIYYDH